MANIRPGICNTEHINNTEIEWQTLNSINNTKQLLELLLLYQLEEFHGTFMSWDSSSLCHGTQVIHVMDSSYLCDGTQVIYVMGLKLFMSWDSSYLCHGTQVIYVMGLKFFMSWDSSSLCHGTQVIYVM